MPSRLLSQSDDGPWMIETYRLPHWQLSDEVGETLPTKEVSVEFICRFFRTPVRTVSLESFPNDEVL